MCLAEALLRVPDSDTRHALIRDKISEGDWRSHFGCTKSPFVNAATADHIEEQVTHPQFAGVLDLSLICSRTPNANSNFIP